MLVLGSGGLSIGQAGEFDYSGSQAIKALKVCGFYWNFIFKFCLVMTNSISKLIISSERVTEIYQKAFLKK